MKLYFNLEYQTTFGEELVLSVINDDVKSSKSEQYKMSTLDGLHWFCEMSRSVKASSHIDYYYSVYRGDQQTRHEWLVIPHRLEFAAIRGIRYTVYDHWLDLQEPSA